MSTTNDDNLSQLQNNTSGTLFSKLLPPKIPMCSRKKLPFKPIDWFAMIAISLFYAFFAFSNLGDKIAPQTSVTIAQNEPLELSAPEGSYIGTICWCLWDIPDIPFKLEVKANSQSEWTLIDEFETKSVFGCWNGLGLPYTVQQIRITHETTSINIGEIVLLDRDGFIILPADASVYPALFDEQDTIPNEITYMSSYYFDEILYAQTAYEFIHRLPAYECTHPPFGKILVSMGVLLFGYNPFGIRFMGTLIGIFMLPFLYLLGRNITGNRGLGAFVSFIFAFDFMHFTQTRVATIDVFITFFIILMYYFMERYVNLSFYDTSLKKTWIPLGLCGISFGFGIATKWTGFYAGAGLALLFFIRLFNYYREYRYALLHPEEATNGVEHQHIINTFKKNTLQTIVFCVFFYLVIPAIIYLLSYIPYIDIENSGFIDKIIENQKFMFKYHSQADFANEFASRWYEWPLMIRPMRYYASNLGGIARQGINAFGNPLVWWVGIPAFIYTAYLAIRQKRKEAGFLCIAYLAQYMPWIFITRPTFIYHYFTSVPFVALMIGYCFLQLKNILVGKKLLNEKYYYCLVFIYAAMVFGLFQLFLPVLSGETISFFYTEDYLSWFKNWQFIVM